MSDRDAIADLEERRRKAMLAADIAALEEMFVDDLSYTHSNAVTERKALYLERLAAGYYDYRALNFLDQDIRIVGDAALVIGRMTGEVMIAGQLKKLNGRTTVVWIRRGTGWQMLTFQSTSLPAA
ncbi:nuclear transport factor 2 family protein [Rhodopseudomonas boonkerdii]|uniref:nuclear transport factor 2 family protein n=1 Tax=Rhodopseudomonas boonkerdii TaxID=475937 RepID=UPI001E4C305C|nr:nuclear transport factor 2 family protein [Rhodopseudomonas boonkerdii]UGV26861.1 nuclear transport factor 2 family protein [Rhodopseudomonas boonkerdii]